MTVTNFKATFLVFNAMERRSMFVLMQNLYFAIKQSKLAAIHYSNTQVFPEGTTSLMDWVKDIVKLVYLEKWNYLFLPLIDKWNSPDKVANMLHIQGMLDWFYDYQDVHPFNSLFYQVMVSSLIKWALFAWVLLVTCCKNQAKIQKAVSDLLSQLSLWDLKILKKY